MAETPIDQKTISTSSEPQQILSTIPVLPGITGATATEKLAIILIFGALSLYSMYQANAAAATAYATVLATYFLSRNGT